MPTIASPRFYVYILCRPNGKPFYVGKGSGSRVFKHDTEARSGHKCHKCNIIRKIWKQGGEVQRYIVFETDDEQEAYAHEVDLIALHGRRNLANLTDGGDGIANPSDSTRQKLSFATKKGWQEPKRQEQGRRPKSDEQKAKMRAAAIVRYQNPEERAKQADRARERWQDPDLRERSIASLRKAIPKRQMTWSKEGRARISAANKARHADPEYRARTTAAMVAHNKSKGNDK